MAFQFFRIPVSDDGRQTQALNAFLATRRVLGVRQEWVANGDQSFWAFSVDFLDAPRGLPPGAPPGDGVGRNGRIDYKEVLPEEEFRVFARLRDLRKELAERDGVPVFSVFTNDQLAEIVRRKCRSLADLKQIAGIGEARCARYGEAALHLLNAPAAEAEKP